MPKIDFQKLEQCQVSGDWEGAKQLIKSFFDNELTAEEIGEVYTRLTLAYIQVSNNINREYLTFLKQTIEAINYIEKSRGQMTENINMADVRKKIAGL